MIDPISHDEDSDFIKEIVTAICPDELPYFDDIVTGKPDHGRGDEFGALESGVEPELQFITAAIVVFASKLSERLADLLLDAGLDIGRDIIKDTLKEKFKLWWRAISRKGPPSPAYMNHLLDCQRLAAEAAIASGTSPEQAESMAEIFIGKLVLFMEQEGRK